MQLRDLDPQLSRAPVSLDRQTTGLVGSGYSAFPGASTRPVSTLSEVYGQRQGFSAQRSFDRSRQTMTIPESGETEFRGGVFDNQEFPIRHFIYPLQHKHTGADSNKESCINLQDGGRAVSLRTTFVNRSFSCTRAFALGYPPKCFYNDTISSAIDFNNNNNNNESDNNISLCLVQSYDRELGLRFLCTMTEFVLSSVQSDHRNSSNTSGGILDAFVSATVIKERRRSQEPILFHRGDSQELHLFSGESDELLRDNVIFDGFKETLVTTALAQSSVDSTVCVLVRITRFDVEEDTTREWKFYMILLTQDSAEGATQRGALGQCYHDMCQDRFNRRKSTLTSYLEQPFTKGIRYFDVIDLVSPDKSLARTDLMLLSSSTVLVEDLTKAYKSLMRRRNKSVAQSNLKEGLLTNNISRMNTIDSVLNTTTETLEHKTDNDKEIEEELEKEVAFYEDDYNSTIENIRNLRQMVQAMDEDIVCVRNDIERLKGQEFDTTQRLAAKKCDENVITKNSAMRQMECNKRDIAVYNAQLSRITKELEETRAEVTRLHNENELLSSKIRAASLIKSTRPAQDVINQDNLSKLQEQVRIKEENIAKLKASIDNNNAFIMTARKSLEHSRTLMGSFQQYRQSNTSTFGNTLRDIF